MRTLRAFVVVLLVPLAWAVAPPVTAAPSQRTELVPAADTSGVPVNINKADVKELMKLEGVGRKVAEKIVEYREHHGLFQKPEEIRKVEGIGSGLWERNRARIVVR